MYGSHKYSQPEENLSSTFIKFPLIDGNGIKVNNITMKEISSITYEIDIKV
jgi:hypothetical protein